MDDFVYEGFDWKVPIEKSLLVNKNLDHASLRLYLLLLSYARDKITAFPSRERLAEDMNCSIRNIDLLKIKLKDLGLLDWVTLSEGIKKRNIYKLIQYKPIQKNTSPVVNSSNQYTKSKKITIDNPLMKEIVKLYQDEHKKFCLSSSEDLKEMIHSGWNNNENYVVSGGDIRNLSEYFETNGEKGLERIKISFGFISDYLTEEIEYGKFYNSDGSELVPTISLFLKSRIQHDKLFQFAKDCLKSRIETKRVS